MKKNLISFIFGTLFGILLVFLWANFGADISNPVVAEASFPERTGYITDISNVIDDKLQAELETKIRAFEPSAQIFIATIPTTGNLSLESYSLQLAERWKVGLATEDNGVLFLIVTDDRLLRIEVGHNIEGYITDEEVGKILDQSVIPELRAGDWGKGIAVGLDRIISEIQ